MFTLFDFFTDPLLRAPMMGSILMCMASGLIGVILLMRKHTLLGEALTHSSFPGVVLGAFFASFFMQRPRSDEGFFLLVGGFFAALLGLYLIHWLQQKRRVEADAALCLVLSVFFGVGVLFASRLQVTNALWFKHIQIYLYGQAATMNDGHILLYGGFFGVTLGVIVLLQRLIQWVHFDRPYTLSIGMRLFGIERTIDLLLLVCIVMGMRTVGVVLLSGMLIAPAVAARPWGRRLLTLFLLAALIGGACGFLGNYLAINMPLFFGHEKLILPTGPLILLTAALFSLFSLFFAPRQGWLWRLFRQRRFRRRCNLENGLKKLWKKGEGVLFSSREVPLFRKMCFEGWVEKAGRGEYRLTQDGVRRARRIVRLHRLWEVYLVDYLGQSKDKVHKSAEQMEHILSPKLERELIQLLNNPKVDPHEQPIP